MITLDPGMQSNYPSVPKDDEFKQLAQQAELGITYGSKVNEGINAFSQLAEQRLQSPLDEQGNPTFLRFSQDTQAIAQQTGEELIKNVESPVAKFAITQSYAQYVKTQLPGLEEKNKEQQLKYYNEAFYNNVKQMKDKLLNDENINVDYYKGEMQKNVMGALASGVINEETAQQIQAQGDKDLVIATANQIAKKNPSLLINSLQNPEFLPGLSIDDRIALQQRAEAIQKDNSIKELESQTKMDQQDISHSTVMKATADAELQDGVLTKERLISIKSALLSDDYAALDKQLDAAITEKQKSLLTQNEITQQLQQGNLDPSWNSTQLKKNYLSNLNSFEERLQRPASLPEKAMLTLQYNGKVTKVIDEMAFSVQKENDPAKLTDLVKTFTYLEAKNPELLKHMPKEQREQLVIARENLLSRNMSPDQAFNEARTPYPGSDNKDIMDKLQSNFHKEIKDFDMDGFLNNQVFDNEYTSSAEKWSLGLVGQSTFVDPRIKSRVETIMKDVYMRTGSMDQAKAVVKHDLQSTYGVSQVGNNPTIMYAPPEKMFPQYKAHELRDDLLQDVQSKFGDTIPADEIGIMAVPSTRGLMSSVNGKPIVQYVITRGRVSSSNDLEFQQPLLDPKSHSFLFWTPSADKIQERRALDKLLKDKASMDAARAKRERVLQLESGFNN